VAPLPRRRRARVAPQPAPLGPRPLLRFEEEPLIARGHLVQVLAIRPRHAGVGLAQVHVDVADIDPPHQTAVLVLLVPVDLDRLAIHQRSEVSPCETAEPLPFLRRIDALEAHLEAAPLAVAHHDRVAVRDADAKPAERARAREGAQRAQHTTHEPRDDRRETAVQSEV
jgi:hypothetical protein